VAQSWAATWHPIIGSWLQCKILVVVRRGSNTGPPEGSGLWRSGLTNRAVVVLVKVIGKRSI
jgi:hypothetical protein